MYNFFRGLKDLYIVAKNFSHVPTGSTAKYNFYEVQNITIHEQYLTAPIVNQLSNIALIKINATLNVPANITKEGIVPENINIEFINVSLVSLSGTVSFKNIQIINHN